MTRLRNIGDECQLKLRGVVKILQDFCSKLNQKWDKEEAEKNGKVSQKLTELWTNLTPSTEKYCGRFPGLENARKMQLIGFFFKKKNKKNQTTFYFLRPSW